MALYHLRTKVISRGKGQSGVAALAYRSGTELTDRRTGEQFDYSKKAVESVEFILPENVPSLFKEWARDIATDKQRVLQEFSDYIEAHELRADSQIYRELEYALQQELTDDQNKEIARKYIDKFCARHGMVAVLNFHKDIDEKTGLEKFHCHTLLLTRNIDENGLGLKNRDWNSKEFHNMWRENWAEIVNDKFAELGIDKRIDHRSLEAQGFEFLPMPKRSRAGEAMVKQGKTSFRYKLFEDAKRQNLFLLQCRPELALEYLTKGQSTFVRDEVIQLVGRYADTHEVFSSLVERIMSSREVVHLEGEDREAVFTTKSQLKLEHDLVMRGEALSNRASHEVIADYVEVALKQYNTKLVTHGGLSQDQIVAIRHITNSGQLKIIEGYAGAGKTTALEAAKDIWESSGYRVVGLAPTNKAARNLEANGIKSFTIDRFTHDFEEVRSQYHSNTVFVIDEAGMVDSRRMRFILKTAEQLGVKLVLVGDGAQLQAIQSGPAFRMLLDKVDSIKLETIVRQRTEWQKEATRLFGQERTYEGLALYQQNDCIKLIKENELPKLDTNISDDNLVKVGSTAKRMAGNLWHKMREELVLQGIRDEPAILQAIIHHTNYKVYEDWKVIRDHALKMMSERKLIVNPDSIALRTNTMRQMANDWIQDRQAYPDAAHIMLTNSNKDVEALNALARESLREQGVISREETLLKVKIEEDIGLDRKKIRTEKIGFSVGDQVIFKANDRGLCVSNGDLGTILDVKGDKVKVQLHGHENRVVSFSNNLFPHIHHGWATTIFTSQSCTYDYVKQLASFELYRNLTYVGDTRHRLECKIYGSDLEFANHDILMTRLARPKEKLATTDYVKSAEEIEKLVMEEARFFDKASQTLLRLKERTQAVTHFVTGLFVDREETISVNTYGSRSEAERAIEKLGLAEKTNQADENDIRIHYDLKESSYGLGSESMLGASTQLDKSDSGGQHGQAKNELSMRPGRLRRASNIISYNTNKRRDLGHESVSPHHLITDKNRLETETHTFTTYPQQLGTSMEIPTGTSKAGYIDKARVPHLRYNLEHIRAKMESNPEPLVSKLLGKVPNSDLSNNHELRYGKKGSFVLTTQGTRAGKWYDFETGEGGSLFGLVERELKLSEFKDQLEYVAGFYGLTPTKESKFTSNHHSFVTGKDAVKERPQTTKASDIETKAKIESVNKAYQMSHPIEGSLAKKYLKEHRKIEGTLPESLRFISSYGKERLPALAAFATDAGGRRTGVQLTYLNPETAKKADIKVKKRSFGKIAGSAVEIKRGEKGAPIFLAEGVETGLSIASVVSNDCTVFAALGVSNFKNIHVEKGQWVIICGDNDTHKPKKEGTDKTPSEISVEKAIAQLKEQGARVIVINPDKAGQDFNDVLQNEELTGVGKYIYRALHKITQDNDTAIPMPTMTESKTYKEIREKVSEDLFNLLEQKHRISHGRNPSLEIQKRHIKQTDIATYYLLTTCGERTDRMIPRLQEKALNIAYNEIVNDMKNRVHETDRNASSPTQVPVVEIKIESPQVVSRADNYAAIHTEPIHGRQEVKTESPRETFAEIIASSIEQRISAIKRYGDASIVDKDRKELAKYMRLLEGNQTLYNEIKQLNPELAKDIDAINERQRTQDRGFDR